MDLFLFFLKPPGGFIFYSDFMHRPGKNSHFHITAENTLQKFLLESLTHESKTTIKSLLAHKQVALNGKPVSRFDTPLHPGDELEIFFDKRTVSFYHPLLKIIYEDAAILVVEKASGLLSMATERDKEKTAYHLLNDYVKISNPRNHVFILHRLDRDTSGILMFAKNQDVQASLQQNWNEMILERKYVAVIEGQPAKESGTIRSYMAESSNYFVHKSNTAEGKLAITHYQVLKGGRPYSLIELDLETGRKNQIRVHMQENGHPVAGDKKYGARSNPLHRLALHAFKLRFIHPVTHKELCFETPVPSRFKALVK